MKTSIGATRWLAAAPNELRNPTSNFRSENLMRTGNARITNLSFLLSAASVIAGCSVSTLDEPAPESTSTAEGALVTAQLGTSLTTTATLNASPTLTTVNGGSIGNIGSGGGSSVRPDLVLRLPGTQAFARTTRTSGTFTTEREHTYNPTSKPVTVRTVNTGVYEVRFGGLGWSQRGNAIVNAFESPAVRCHAASWGADGDDLLVGVRCYDRAANLAAGKFAVWYAAGGTPSGRPGLAYLRSDSASASHTPSSAAQYSSAGGTHTVTRNGVGQYSVILANQAVFGGTVAVSAFGAAAGACSVASFYPVGANLQVDVRCFGGTGEAADRRFALRFLSTEPGASTDLQYVWAEQPTAASYAPSAWYQSTSQANGPARITRAGAGHYVVRFPATVAAYSVAVATPYGTGAVDCQTSSLTGASGNADVRVRCYDAAGRGADAMFTLALQNGEQRYRTITQTTEPGTPTRAALGSWEGHLRVTPPWSTGAALREVRWYPLASRIRDHWYRNADGSLTKSIVDRDRNHRGLFTVRADGSSHLAIDVDGDGLADITELFGPNGVARVIVSEPLGREALDAWLRRGENPLCRGTGPDEVTTSDLLSGRMLGCPGRNYRGAVSGLAALNSSTYAPPDRSWDPVNAICNEVRAAAIREGFGDGVNRAYDWPITTLTATAAREFLNNGFDGQRDGAGERAARTILGGPVIGAALLTAFVTDAIAGPIGDAADAIESVADPTEWARRVQDVARRIVEQNQSGGTSGSGGGTGGGGSGEPGPTSGDTTPPPPGPQCGGTSSCGDESRPAELDGRAAWARMCQSRDEGGGARRREFQAALAPQCDDPSTGGIGGPAVCVGRDGLERVDVGSAVQTDGSCQTGNSENPRACTPRGGLDEMRARFHYATAGLEGLVTCNPIVCRPDL